MVFLDDISLSGGDVLSNIYQLFIAKGRYIELDKKIYVNIEEESDQHRVDYGVFNYESMTIIGSGMTKELLSLGKRHKGYLVDEYDRDLFFRQLACPIFIDSDQEQSCAKIHIMKNAEFKYSILIAYRNRDLKVNNCAIAGDIKTRLQTLIDENQTQPDIKNQAKKIGLQPISSQKTKYSNELSELLFKQLFAILC